MAEPTLATMVARCSDQLSAAGIEAARLEAEILACYVLQKPRSYLYAYGEERLPPDCITQFMALVEARCNGQPVAYLTGEREFWSLPFYVDERVLIPRAETECLVEAILDLPLPAALTVIDLGTGSGAIALALAKERPGWYCLAADRMQGPLQVVQKNSRLLCGLGELKQGPVLLQADWLSACAAQSFELIVSNPPYIEAGDEHLEQGDLRFEPRSALASGDDGLRDLRTICQQAQYCLKPGGYLALEHGHRQQPSVIALLKEQGFSLVGKGSDLADRPRFVIASKVAQ